MSDLLGRLRELLLYDPRSGEFFYRVRTTNSVCVGDIAGTIHRTGYRMICIDRRKYLAHRLVWLYVNGEWPRHQVDHIDGDKLNNRITNLRDVSVTVNQQNQRKAGRRNKTGFLGVTLNGGRFKATIVIDGKQKYLGSYAKPEIAHAAYLDAKRMHHAGNTL